MIMEHLAAEEAEIYRVETKNGAKRQDNIGLIFTKSMNNNEINVFYVLNPTLRSPVL